MKEKIVKSSRKKNWHIQCQLHAMKYLEEARWTVESAKELGYELQMARINIIYGIAKLYEKQPVWWK